MCDKWPVKPEAKEMVPTSIVLVVTMMLSSVATNGRLTPVNDNLSYLCTMRKLLGTLCISELSQLVQYVTLSRLLIIIPCTSQSVICFSWAVSLDQPGRGIHHEVNSIIISSARNNQTSIIGILKFDKRCRLSNAFACPYLLITTGTAVCIFIKSSGSSKFRGVCNQNVL